MKLLPTLLLSGLLVACGGSPTSGSLSEPLLITGTVAKGLMKQAKIEVFGVNADGSIKATPLASATTNGGASPGYYSVVVPSYSGVLIVKASMASTTTMLDEETRAEITPTSSFVMRTALAVQPGQALKVNVNPFTESAVTEIEAGTPKFTEAAVRQANHQQAQVLSVDPVSGDSAFDASDRTKPASSLALHLAALSKIAQNSTTLTALGCTSASTTSTRIDCIVKAIREKKHMTSSIRQALNTAIDDVRTSRQLTSVAALVQAPISLSVDTATRTPVQRIKTFIATLRSNSKAIDSTDNSLRTHFEVLQSEVDNRSAPATGSSLEAVELALKGVDLWLDIKTDQTSPFIATTSFYGLYSGVSPASCTFYQDASYTQLATAVGNANYLECRTSPRREEATDSNGYWQTCLNTFTDTSINNWCYQMWTSRLRIRPDTAATNTFKVQSTTRASKYINYSGTFKEPVSANGTYIGRTVYGTYSTDYESTIVYARDANRNYTQAAVSGYFSPGLKNVAGTGSSDYFSNSTMSPCGYSWCYKPSRYEVLGDRHQIALDTVLTGGYNTAGSKKFTLAGSIKLFKNGFLESQLELGHPSYVAFDLDSNQQVVHGSEEVSLDLKISTPTGYLSGNIFANNFATNALGTDASPTNVIFTGNMGLGTTEFLGLTISGKDLNQANYNPTRQPSATNYKLRHIDIQTTVTIPNRPTLNLHLSAVEKRADVNSGFFNMQYSQGSLVANIFGGKDGVSSTVDQVMFQTTDGISMTFTDKDAEVVDLFYQGHKVGQYDTSRSMLLYADGSFEQY